MPRYTHHCTKCGKALHPKQSIFRKEVPVQLYSSLVKPAEQYLMEFCSECCSQLLAEAIDSLILTDWNRFVKRYGEKITSNGKNNNSN